MHGKRFGVLVLVPLRPRIFGLGIAGGAGVKVKNTLYKSHPG
jgi:hypothetical protein